MPDPVSLALTLAGRVATEGTKIEKHVDKFDEEVLGAKWGKAKTTTTK